MQSCCYHGMHSKRLEPRRRQIPAGDIVGALLEGKDGGEPSPGFRIWYCPRLRGSQAGGKPARRLLKTGEMRARSAGDAQRIVRAIRARAVHASGERRIVVIINPKSGRGRCAAMRRRAPADTVSCGTLRATIRGPGG